MIHTLTSAAHHAPEAPGSFLGRPVKGIPDSEPRAPSVVSGARSTCAARAALDELPRCSLRSPNTRTRSSYPHGSAPFHAAAASFGLDTPLSPLSFRIEVFELSLLKYVPSRARTRGVPRYFQPTSATQSVSTSLHPCSRRSTEHPAHTGLHRELRRFTPTELLGRDRSILSKVFACRCRGDLRLLTSLSTIPLRALRPLSRTDAGLNRLDPFHERAVTLTPASLVRDAFGWSRFERRFLAEGTVVPFGAKARLESRSRERVTPPRRPKVSFCRCGLALMISAREVLPRS